MKLIILRIQQLVIQVQWVTDAAVITTRRGIHAVDTDFLDLGFVWFS